MQNTPRFRSPRWRDPRVFIGLFLVLASVCGTWFVVRQVADTVTVWAARTALVPGATISEDALSAVEVRLPDDGAGYLPTAESTPVGSTVEQPIGAGELIPSSALTSPDSLDGRVVALSIYGSVPAAVQPGARVDIWAADLDADEPAPVLLLENAAVISVARDEGGFTASTDVKVEVYVPRSRIENVLTAQAGDHRMSVVAMPGDGR